MAHIKLNHQCVLHKAFNQTVKSFWNLYFYRELTSSTPGTTFVYYTSCKQKIDTIDHQ